MLIPLFYCIRYKKESFVEVGTIFLAMVLIVILYWPLTTSLVTTSNILVKFLLFIFLPMLLLLVLKRDKSLLHLDRYGIKKEGLKKSVMLGLLFIPIMLIITFIVKYFIGVTTEANTVLGIVSFIESFSEEFFFRGILFLLLLNRTNLKVAYISSFASFVLMHPQHFTDLFIISTIVQGILTIEICRRTKNITGAWFVHGTNRFFSIAIAPFII
jgi:membrane protease YdiL (CAAX protease family)